MGTDRLDDAPQRPCGALSFTEQDARSTHVLLDDGTATFLAPELDDGADAIGTWRTMRYVPKSARSRVESVPSRPDPAPAPAPVPAPRDRTLGMAVRPGVGTKGGGVTRVTVLKRRRPRSALTPSS